jgi:PIN domain nuclease of toxin-antitoxin system
MTHSKTEALLKKINYIEADVEIQKQILFSIPSNQKTEMEKTITLIAARKEEIEVLRQELKELDPDEFDRIIVFEKAVNEFRQIATDNPFDSIVNRNVNEECTLALHNGDKKECLIKACDCDGNWTIITVDGQLQQYPAADVAEKPPEKNDFQ